MGRHYFEELHRAEERHAEWHLLDLALVERSQARPLRVALGHWMMQAGARIAGEPRPLPPATLTDRCTCPPGNY